MNKKNLLLWIPVFVFYILLSVPAGGQRTEQVYYKDGIWQIGDTARYTAACRRGKNEIYYADDAYNDSVAVLFTKTVYAMWDTCAVELGYTYTKESFLEASLLPRAMWICVDAQGNLVYLALCFRHQQETKEEKNKIRKLLVKLKETRFPPFAKKPKRIHVDHDFYIDINPDSAVFRRTVPIPRPDKPRNTIIL